MSLFLAPLSFVYHAGLVVDRALKQTRRRTLPCPVISIGNISVGGTGKTPLVIKLVSDLKRWGFNPAVLTRGYGAKEGFSDEAALLMKYHPDVPIGVGADRVQSALDILTRQKVDVFVLDDGFQHWRIKRDLDIVCVDATNPWEGGHLLPWGRLREPKSALGRADIVLLTRMELVKEKERERLIEEVSRIVGAERVLSSSFKSVFFDWKSGETIIPEDLEGKKLVVLSAVAHPQALEGTIKKAGADVYPLRFRDHYYYRQDDLRAIEERLRKKEADLLTTEKDLVKLERTRWGKHATLNFHVYVASVHHSLPAADEKKWASIIMARIKKR